MLPRAAILDMANNNLSALHVVRIPSWGVYECDTTYAANQEYQSEDVADNFEKLARRSGIKVSCPLEKENDKRGPSANLSPAATEFVPRHSTRENVQPTNTPSSTNETRLIAPPHPSSLTKSDQPTTLPVSSGLTDNLQPTSFSVPSLSFDNVQPTTLPVPSSSSDNLQPTTLSASFFPSDTVQPTTLSVPFSSPVEATSPMNEEKKLLEMFENVLKEKKAQFKILQRCKNDMEESKRTITFLNATKTALEAEVQRLTEELEKLNERNSILSDEVEALTERLIESEEVKKRLKSQVGTLTSKLQEKENDQESEKTLTSSLFDSLTKAEMEKERALNAVELLSHQYEILSKSNEIAESTAKLLADELQQSKRDKDRLEEDKVNLLSKLLLKEFGSEEERKESDHCAINDKISSEKNTSSTTKMDSLDGFNSFGSSEDQNWTVVQKKTKGLKSGKSMHLYSSQSSSKKVKVKRSQSFDVAMLGVKNGFPGGKRDHNNEVVTRGGSDNFEPATPDCLLNHNTFAKFDFNSNPLIENPVKQEKPVRQAGSGVASSNGLNGTKTETIISPKVDTLSTNVLHEIPLNTVESMPSNLGFEQQTPAFPNCTESYIKSNPLFDPAILRMSAHHSGSLPGLKTKDDGKSRDIPEEKDKKKQNLTSFDILMNQLADNFPSKTRNELLVLLKLAKTTFGDQGFRKKKIEEIIKRVGELIEPENTEAEATEKICSICHDRMDDNETILECGHRFHEQCVKQWIRAERTCPLCRSHALTEDEFPTLA